MAYVGTAPNPGQNREVDDISSGFNGSTTAFTLQVGGSNVSPGSNNNIVVSLGGVIQNPGNDFTIAASTITFTTAPASGLSFFGIILGQQVDVAALSDGTSPVVNELKAATIKGLSASTAAITLNSSDGTCTANITNRSNENYLINGGCRIDQRNSGSAVTSGYAIDRTHIEGFDGGGTGTAQRVTDSPAGLGNSLKITVTGTDGTLAASAFYTLRQIIEGRNIAHLGFGASGGTSVTLSFFVKSSVTGTFCASLGNGTNNRTMPKEYTINSADTWEKKSLTFPADTTGTWGTDNGRGFSIRWCLGAGSTRQGTADTYNPSEAHATSNQTNLFAINGATFQITGLKLESGTVATDFIPRPFGEELTLCQRYYINLISGSVIFPQNNVYMSAQFPTTMRAAPTVTISVTGTTAGLLTRTTGFRAVNSLGPQDAAAIAEAEL